MVFRNQYVARRVLTRMKQRGEPMLLRRISMVAGPEAFPNPPNLSNDLTVAAAHLVGGQSYLDLTGSTAIGRLIPGDQVIRATVPPTIWTVDTMPASVSTDSDGIPLVDGSGTPLFGSTLAYHPDSLAWNNRFPVVPVHYTSGPSADVTTMTGHPVTFTFFADVTVYGSVLSYEQMRSMGWVELDGLALSIAAEGVDPPPKINDLIILSASGGEKRAITQTGRRFSNGTNFLFPVQVE